MRAKEFITEVKAGDMPGSFKDTLPKAGHTIDKFYDMYRLAIMVGRMPDDADDVDPHSWIGNTPFMGAYTPEEYELIKKAAKKMGIPFSDHVPSESQEPDAINTQSITKPFKGY